MAYEAALQTAVQSGVQTGPAADGTFLRNQISHDLYFRPGILHCFNALLQQAQQGGCTLLQPTSLFTPLGNVGGDGSNAAMWPLTTHAGASAGLGDGSSTTTAGTLGPVGTPVLNRFWADDGKSHHGDNAFVLMEAARLWADAANPSPAQTWLRQPAAIRWDDTLQRQRRGRAGMSTFGRITQGVRTVNVPFTYDEATNTWTFAGGTFGNA